MKQVERVYRMLTAAASRLQSPFLLAVRLYWGWQFAQDGLGKLQNLDRVTEFFTSLGLPAPGATAAFIGGLELIGGIVLALGIGARMMALLLTCNMLMAYIAADREALLSVFSDPDTFYKAAPYTYLFASLLVLIFGPGKLSVDAMLAKKFSPAVGSGLKSAAG